MTDYRDGAFTALDGSLLLALALVFLAIGALCAPALTQLIHALPFFGG